VEIGQILHHSAPWYLDTWRYWINESDRCYPGAWESIRNESESERAAGKILAIQIVPQAMQTDAQIE
jgi:hypothetical protein